jgi:hypothetical protein
VAGLVREEEEVNRRSPPAKLYDRRRLREALRRDVENWRKAREREADLVPFEAASFLYTDLGRWLRTGDSLPRDRDVVETARSADAIEQGLAALGKRDPSVPIGDYLDEAPGFESEEDLRDAAESAFLAREEAQCLFDGLAAVARECLEPSEAAALFRRRAEEADRQMRSEIHEFFVALPLALALRETLLAESLDRREHWYWFEIEEAYKRSVEQGVGDAVAPLRRPGGSGESPPGAGPAGAGSEGRLIEMRDFLRGWLGTHYKVVSSTDLSDAYNLAAAEQPAVYGAGPKPIESEAALEFPSGEAQFHKCLLRMLWEWRGPDPWLVIHVEAVPGKRTHVLDGWQVSLQGEAPAKVRDAFVELPLRRWKPSGESDLQFVAPSGTRGWVRVLGMKGDDPDPRSR